MTRRLGRFRKLREPKPRRKTGQTLAKHRTLFRSYVSLIRIIIALDAVARCTAGEQNDARSLLRLDGQRQIRSPFRKGVQIRTFRRKRNGLHAARCQHGPKRGTEFRVAIVQNIAAGMKITPSLLGRTAGDLLHPLLIRMSGDSRHVDSAAFQMKKEQHALGHQPPPGEHLRSEEIGAG